MPEGLFSITFDLLGFPCSGSHDLPGIPWVYSVNSDSVYRNVLLIRGQLGITRLVWDKKATVTQVRLEKKTIWWILISAEAHIWKRQFWFQQHESMDTICLVLNVQSFGGGVMIWEVRSLWGQVNHCLRVTVYLLLLLIICIASWYNFYMIMYHVRKLSQTGFMYMYKPWSSNGLQSLQIWNQ